MLKNFSSNFINFISGLLSNKFKNDLIKSLKKAKIEPNIFVDVGGHQGEYTDLFLNKKRCGKKIFIFEPIPKYYNFLTKKYKVFKNIKIFNLAVGDKKLKRIFFQGFHERSSTLKKLNKKSLYFFFKSFLLKKIIHKRIIVQQVSLDFFFNFNQKIDLLKIDVEGNELEVLNGCKKLIKKNLIRAVYIEILNHNYYEGYSRKKIHMFLLNNGYKLIKIHKTPFLFAEDRLYIKN